MVFHVHHRVSMVEEPESMVCHGQTGWCQAADTSSMSYSSYVMAVSSSLSVLIHLADDLRQPITWREHAQAPLYMLLTR